MNDKQTSMINVTNILNHSSEREINFIMGYLLGIKMAAEGADKSHV